MYACVVHKINLMHWFKYQTLDCNLFSGSCYIKMFFTLLTLAIHNKHLLALFLPTL